MTVGRHVLPQLGYGPLGIGEHHIHSGQRCGGAIVAGFVERVQHDAHQQRLARLLPMRFKTSSVWIHKDRGQVLHVGDFMFSAEPDFIQRIPPHTALGCCRFKAQDLILGVLLSPSGGEFPQLPFQIGNKGAVRPGEQCRNNQPHPFARSRRRIGQHMLRPTVAQVVQRSFGIQPPAHVHTIG